MRRDKGSCGDGDNDTNMLFALQTQVSIRVCLNCETAQNQRLKPYINALLLMLSCHVISCLSVSL